MIIVGVTILYLLGGGGLTSGSMVGQVGTSTGTVGIVTGVVL